MKKIRFKSLTMQIWVYFIVMIIAIGIAFFSIDYVLVNKFEKERAYRNLEVFSDLVINSTSKLNKDDMMKHMAKYSDFHDLDYFFAIKSMHSTKVFGITRFGDGVPEGKKKAMNDITQDITNYVDKMKSSTRKEIKSETDEGNLFIITRINSSDFSKVTGQYLIAFSKRPLNNTNFESLIYFSFAIIIIALFVSKLISNSLSKPLKSLEEYTKKIAKKEWTKPLNEERQDEIGRLIVSMNKMQKSLKKADEDQSAFLQSISHDLKTPVMVIKSYAESILDGIYTDDLFSTAQIMSDEASKLEHKIRKMIYFNSLDYIIENEKNLSEVCLDEIFQSLYERFKFIRQDIKWQLSLDKVKLYCNGENILVAFENIMENQLRYAKTMISVKLFKENNFITILIHNDGDKIKEDDLSKIFDRFYKEKKGNFGLGLAITKKIIDHYNGSVKAVNEEKGVTFIVKFTVGS